MAISTPDQAGEGGFVYKGVMHLHTRYSDGSGRVEKVIRAGQEAGLDYLIITDHNTLAAKEAGYEGWHDKLLVLVGEEASYSHEHCIVLGIERPTDGKLPVTEIVKQARQQGGTIYVVHPHGSYKPFLRMKSYPWTSWESDDFTGMEIWSYMFDWIRAVRFYNLPYYYLNPNRHIQGPFRETLRKWDQLAQRRSVVGVSGVDAHARKMDPLGLIRVFPYRKIFQTLRNYVILDQPFSGDQKSDIQRLTRAMAAGHIYISFDALASGDGFSFTVQTEGKITALMGDELAWSTSSTLLASLPQPATLRLLWNGKIVAEAVDQHLAYPVKRPGVYRLEVYLRQRPWIFSNPLYIR